jgi:hypothetical protein
MSMHAESDRQRLVLLIQLYVILLVIEGALRKWFLPSLSDPLLLARDPVAVLICFLAYRSEHLVFDSYMRSLCLLLAGFVLVGALQLINGIGGSPLVIGYGLRTYLLHLPVAFVMARVLNPLDIRRILMMFLWAALPMAILMTVQFDSSPNSWVNLGVAGHRGQIFAAPGRIRPAGTFSFVNGPIGFFSIAIAALIASAVDLRGVSWPLRIAGWVAISLAAAVSGSRSFLAAMAAIMLVGVAGWARGRSSKLGRGLVVSAFTALIAVNVLGSFDTVREGAEVIQSRLDQWGNGGLSRRLMYDYNTVKWAILDSPLLGVGLGAGTNAGAALQGTKSFRWGEGEWPRVIFESGPILGLLYLIWRVWITLAVGRAALRISGSGVLLPLLLWGACASSLLSGQWGQTSIQGFGVLTLGLTLAAGRTALRQRTPQPVAERTPVWVQRMAAGRARA